MCIHEEGMKTSPQYNESNKIGGRDGVLGTPIHFMHKEHTQNFKQSSADMPENLENENIQGVGLCTF